MVRFRFILVTSLLNADLNKNEHVEIFLVLFLKVLVRVYIPGSENMKVNSLFCWFCTFRILNKRISLTERILNSKMKKYKSDSWSNYERRKQHYDQYPQKNSKYYIWMIKIIRFRELLYDSANLTIWPIDILRASMEMEDFNG